MAQSYRQTFSGGQASETVKRERIRLDAGALLHAIMHGGSSEFRVVEDDRTVACLVGAETFVVAAARGRAWLGPTALGSSADSEVGTASLLRRASQYEPLAEALIAYVLT